VSSITAVPSAAFLAFVAVVAVLINLSPAIAWRRAVLLIANLTFFVSFAATPIDLLPFGALLVAGYAFVLAGMRIKTGAAAALACGTLLIAFCWLKRYDFIPHGAFLPFAYLTVGMSYVFFRIMSLVIDAFQDALPAPVTPLTYVNYTLNFTAFVAGPIQLYKDYLRTESVSPAPLDQGAVGGALARIAAGAFKVMVLSPLFSVAQDRCVALLTFDGSALGRIALGAGVLAIFPVYLYLNFSGYTDVVIGAARLLRLELPENFNNPFIATGYLDYWTRWHMTLSNWLKTYVYSPLVISLMRRYPSPRVEPLLGVFAYFVTFFLIGAWHGQTSMFLFLGFLMGLGASINKIYQLAATRRLGRARYRALCAEPVYASVSRGLTFTWVAFTLLWFWSSWGQLAGFTRGLSPAGAACGIFAVFVAATLALAALKWLQDRCVLLDLARTRPRTLRYAKVAFATLLAAATISVAVVLNAPAPHIVYKAF